MGEVEIPPIFDFVSYKYVQHAESGRREDCSNRYRSHLNPKNRDMPDEKAFAHEKIMALGLKKTALYLEGGLDQQNGDPYGGVVTEGGLNSEKSDSGLSAFLVEAANVPGDDYSII